MDLTTIYHKENRILITGGGGYLGSMLASRIAPSGASCLLLDRAFNPKSVHLSKEYPGVTLQEADLKDLPTLTRTCRRFQPEFVFHFAASIDRTRDFNAFDKIWEINVGGTLHLLEALLLVPYRSFVFAGTSDVYGTQNPVPFREDQDPNPLTPYAMTKLMAEKEIIRWSTSYDKPYTLGRIFLFIGPEMPPTTFTGQLTEALKAGREFLMTKGEQQRDYLFLDDLLDGLCHLSVTPGANGEVVNLCSGTSVSMKELAGLINASSGSPVRISHTLPYREQEIWEIRGSTDKLKQLFPDFNPKPLPTAIQYLF